MRMILLMMMALLMMAIACTACAYVTLPAADSHQTQQCVDEGAAFDRYLAPIELPTGDLSDAGVQSAMSDADASASLSMPRLVAEPTDTSAWLANDNRPYRLADLPRARPVGRELDGHPQTITVYRADHVVQLN